MIKNSSDERIRTDAILLARKIKRKIAKEKAALDKFPPDKAPTSVFMAGSPGAGKTESSKRLIEEFSKDGHSILRIDIDDLRNEFDTYTGINSNLFQAATTIIAEKIQDVALEQSQNFIFDGTLTNLDKARRNIERSLARDRLIQILYVYQDPFQAWNFVKARAKVDGRIIPKEDFIKQYFKARENVHILKKEFGEKDKSFVDYKKY